MVQLNIFVFIVATLVAVGLHAAQNVIPRDQCKPRHGMKRGRCQVLMD